MHLCQTPMFLQLLFIIIAVCIRVGYRKQIRHTMENTLYLLWDFICSCIFEWALHMNIYKSVRCSGHAFNISERCLKSLKNIDPYIDVECSFGRWRVGQLS